MKIQREQMDRSLSNERYVHIVARLETILRDRERELLELKGPCSCKGCKLHYAHSGPCNIPAEGLASIYTGERP